MLKWITDIRIDPPPPPTHTRPHPHTHTHISTPTNPHTYTHAHTLSQSQQYRDFISQLPETLACQVLSFIPPKDILRHCCRVSSRMLLPFLVLRLPRTTGLLCLDFLHLKALCIQLLTFRYKNFSMISKTKLSWRPWNWGYFSL